MGVQRPQVPRYRYVVGGIILLLNFSIGLSFFAVSPLLPLIMDDYAIGHAAASLLTGLVILVQAFLSIPAGVLAARFELKLVFAVGASLGGVLALSFLARDFNTLLTLRLVYGVGMALLWPATGPLVMQWFRPTERPLWNSLIAASGSAGMTVSMFIAAPMAEALGWRGALSVLSVLTWASALLWMFFGRVRGEPRGTLRTVSRREIVSTLFSRPVLLLALADAASYGLYAALASWLPTYYNEVRGLPLKRVGFITGLLPFAGMVAVLLSGLLAVKLPRRKPFFIVPGVVMGLAGFGSFLSGNLAVMYASVFVLGFVAWAYWPVLMVVSMELPGATPGRVAMTWGMVTTLGSITAFISPLTVGAMTDAWGTYIPGFSLWAGFSFLLLVSGVLLPETGKPQPSRDSEP